MQRYGFFAASANTALGMNNDFPLYSMFDKTERKHKMK